MHKQFQKLTFIFFFLLTSFTNSYGQSKKIDSLKKILKTEKVSDSIRMDILLKLGWDLTFIDIDSSRLYLYKCIALAQKNQNEINIGTGYAYIGSGYFQSDKFDSALYYFQIAEDHFLKDTSATAKENVVVNRMSMGTVALQQNHHKTAIEYYLKVIDYIENVSHSGDWRNLATAYANTGLVYNDLKQYDKALDYHSKAINICKKHPEELQKTAQIQMLIALDLLNLQRFDEVIPALNKAEINLKKINSAQFFTTLYSIKGRYLNVIKNYKEAIVFLKKALDYNEKNNQKFQKANVLYQLGISYFGLGNYSQSLAFFLPALKINRELRDKVREEASLNYVAKTYAKTKNYQLATEYFQQYISLNDSMHKAETKRKINEIENKYQAEKKQKDIIALKKNNELQKAELRDKNILNIVLISSCALLLLVAVLFYKNFKNKNRLLLQNEKLHDQKLSELEKERKLIAAQSLMKGQEEERTRLARDLHDGVGGLLSGVKLSMSNMKGNAFLSEENAHSFNNVITQLDQSIAELRRVSHNMMPESLIKYGLKEALENYCESLNFSGKIKVQLQTYGMEERMDQSTEIVVYRMIQELLNNVIKHADAKNVLIQLVRKQDRFTLTVEDDGKGFDTQEINHKNGAGLANIKARAEYLNGNVDIISSGGEGTSVNIEGTCI
jgi:signal transduction histidine kinase